MAKKIKKAILEQLGEALHTALRKCCDSRPTSIAYNLIHEIDSVVWHDYLDYLRDKLKGVKFKDKQHLAIVMAGHTVLYFDDEWRKRLGDKKNDSAYRKKFTNGITLSLKCAFELFSEEDYRGYCAYLMG